MTGPTDTSLLPDKPSELMRVALADLEKGEADPDFEVCMAFWLIKNRSNECCGCMAGAVMRYSLGAVLDEWSETTPKRFPQFTAKLQAINSFRTGGIQEGLYALGLGTIDEVPEKVVIADYNVDPGLFKETIRSIITMLESHNL